MTTKIMLACQVELAAMQARNQARVVAGLPPLHLESDFQTLAHKYGLDSVEPTPATEPPKASTCVCGHDTKEHETFGVCQVSECGCMGYEDPELPKARAPGTCSCGHAGAFHHPGDGHCWICRCRQYEGTSSMPPQPNFPGHPEASRVALPAEVEAIIKKHIYPSLNYAPDDVITAAQEIASLWPKAGQVPSVPFTELELRDKLFGTPATNVDELARAVYPWILARMGQPAVTVEKLVQSRIQEIKERRHQDARCAFTLFDLDRAELRALESVLVSLQSLTIQPLVQCPFAFRK